MELWVIRHEWHDDMEAWALAYFGLLRPPGRPSVSKLSVEIGSVLLITIGVVGELGVGIKIASINGVLRGQGAELRSKGDELRGKSDQLVALLHKQIEDERLARAHLEQAVSARRLTGEQKEKFTKFLKQYPDPVGIVVVSAMLDNESSDFADDFDVAIQAAKGKTLRVKNRLTQRTGISIGTLEGTPEFDPWKRPIASLKKRIEDALKAIHVPYADVTFGKDDVHSTDPAFEAGPIYLVIEHRPPVGVKK